MKRGLFLAGLGTALVVPQRRIWAMGQTAIARPQLVSSGSLFARIMRTPKQITYAPELHKTIIEVLDSVWYPYTSEAVANMTMPRGGNLKVDRFDPAIRTEDELQLVLHNQLVDDRGLPVFVDIG